MELWRVRPDDEVVLPVFPGRVTVEDVGLGGRPCDTRIEWTAPGGMSGRLDLGDFTEVVLLAAGDGVNAVWLSAEPREEDVPGGAFSGAVHLAACPGGGR